MHSDPNGSANQPVPDGVDVYDLGPLKSHAQRHLGLSVDRRPFLQEAKRLDAVLIQGPTSLVPHVARWVHPALPVFVLVGFWTDPPAMQFKTRGSLRRLLTRGMMIQSEAAHRRAYPRGIILGNNPEMGVRYGQLAPFHFISKCLYPRDELTSRPPRTPGEPMQVLWFSRVDPDKHLETVLRAARSLGSEFHFRIVGPGYPDYVAYLREMAARLNVSEFVTFEGGVPFAEREAAFADADAFVFHTCATEGFPRAIWDAFAHQVPVVAAAYPGAREALTHERDLLWFERCNANELAAALRRLRDDAQLRVRLRDEGLKRVQENALEPACRRIVEVVQEAVVPA